MSNLIEHAKREFLKLGYKPIEECENEPDKWIQENVLELLEVFSKQGHSGSSAPFAINYFKKLAAFKPLAPIMCTNDEWNDVVSYGSDYTYQNNRCSAVFKEGIDGIPYYLDAIVWRNQNGITYTGGAKNYKGERINSRQTIKLPFNPKTFYIDVIEYETSKDDFEFYIADESQLKEVWQYYEKPESTREIRLKKLNKINND